MYEIVTDDILVENDKFRLVWMSLLLWIGKTVTKSFSIVSECIQIVSFCKIMSIKPMAKSFLYSIRTSIGKGPVANHKRWQTLYFRLRGILIYI